MSTRCVDEKYWDKESLRPPLTPASECREGFRDTKAIRSSTAQAILHQTGIETIKTNGEPTILIVKERWWCPLPQPC